MLLISKINAISQKTAEDFGYKHLSYKFQDDKVDLIVISKLGEEKKAKPLFFFCQDSQPRPIVIYNEKGLFGVLPFSETPFLEQYHVVIVGKPNIPIMANTKELDQDFNYMKDRIHGIPPKGYTDRNYLDYYVFRNNFVLKQLFKERWVDKTEVVVAGHADGSSIAAKWALLQPKITKLIYSGGNPFGRFVNIFKENKQQQSMLTYWKKVVENQNVLHYDQGETYKALYGFSLPQRENLLQLDIPVLLTYDAHDVAATYINLFQIEIIRDKRKNFEFIPYEGLEDDFLTLNPKKEMEYDNEKWNSIAQNWLLWLDKK